MTEVSVQAKPQVKVGGSNKFKGIVSLDLVGLDLLRNRDIRNRDIRNREDISKQDMPSGEFTPNTSNFSRAGLANYEAQMAKKSIWSATNPSVPSRSVCPTVGSMGSMGYGSWPFGYPMQHQHQELPPGLFGSRPQLFSQPMFVFQKDSSGKSCVNFEGDLIPYETFAKYLEKNLVSQNGLEFTFQILNNHRKEIGSIQVRGETKVKGESRDDVGEFVPVTGNGPLDAKSILKAKLFPLVISNTSSPYKLCFKITFKDGSAQEVKISRTKDGHWRTWFPNRARKRLYIRIHPCTDKEGEKKYTTISFDEFDDSKQTQEKEKDVKSDESEC